MSNLIPILSRFHEQITTGFQEAKKITLPSSYQKATHIVVMAMGGSALGAGIIKHAFFNELKVPLEIINGYHLPATANQNSLVILSSFSGTTEEVLLAYKEAKKKNLKMLVVTSGGDLAKWSIRDQTPIYLFDPSLLAPEPRYGTGFMTAGPLAILSKLGFLPISEKEIKAATDHLKKGFAVWESQAKKTAHGLKDRGVVIVSSEHLEGAAHVFANQINESSKHFSARFPIPELSHHLMEGLTFPKEVVKQLTFVFLQSSLYHPRVLRRYGLTETVVKKNKAKTITIDVAGKTFFAEALEVVVRGGLITAYMAEYSKVNPLSIPWVDWFKSEMAK